MFAHGWPLAAALAGSLIVGMFYVFPSGVPQPGDYLLAAAALSVLAPAARSLVARGDGVVLLLVGWTAVVSTSWTFISGDPAFLVAPLYYAYNAVVFTVCAYCRAMYPATYGPWFRLSMALALVVQVLIVLGTTDSVRAVGSFNNPNQLGYWSVLALVLFLILAHDRPWGLRELVVISLAGLCTILSVSLAALVAFAVVVIAFFMLHPAAAQVRVMVACVAVLFVGVMWIDGSVPARLAQTGAIEAIVARQSRSVSGDEFAERGYDRFTQSPALALIGAGEGGYARFHEEEELELHSSFGTMLFSYGVPGLALFGMVLYRVLRKLPLVALAYFGAVLLYGLAHQGLRFTEFWVLAATVAGVSKPGTIVAQAFGSAWPHAPATGATARGR